MKYRDIGGLCVAFMLAGNACPQGVLTPFAGGNWVFNGNGKPAVNAPLGSIFGITSDPAGNVVIADLGNNIVERINPDATLSIVAGNTLFFGVHAGDGGPAVNAALNDVYAVAYDPAGNLYIAESDRLSQVSPQGIINTYAGGGTDATSNGIPALQAALSPYSLGGSLVVNAAGVVYFSEFNNNRVRKVTPDGAISTVAGTGAPGYSGDGGIATAATLNAPAGLALDSAGNLYIADLNNNAVRRVTPGGTISTFVANADYATGLATDNAGDLYLFGYGTVEKLTSGASRLTMIAGVSGSSGGFSGDGGPALGAQFSIIGSLIADNRGDLFIGDALNDRVRKISATGIVTTVAGNGQYRYNGEGVPALTSPVLGTGNLAIDKAGNIYYSDVIGNRVRKVSAGIINTVAGTGVNGFSGDGGPALQATLDLPRNLTFDAAGNLYIADYSNDRVRKVAQDGTISTYAQLPGAVRGLVFDAAGNLYASDETNSTVYRIDTKGSQTVFAGTGSAGYSGDGGQATLAKLNQPSGLAMDALGNLYIADSLNGRIRVVSPQGVITSLVHGGANLRELAFDSAGNLYVSDETLGVVYKITPSVAISVFAGGGLIAPGNGGLSTQANLTPYGLVCDASGNVYIDYEGGIDVVLATPPTISLQQNSLSFSAPSGGAPLTQSTAVLSAVPGLAFAVVVNTANGGNWLSTDAASGATPLLLSITADPSQLAPGTYTGTVTIMPVLATPAALTINVTFTVGTAVPPQISVDQPDLSFTYPKGAAARSATLKISNAGGGSLSFSASAVTKTGGAWLAITPASGSVLPGAPVSLTVTADPGSLAPGTYTGSILIQSNGGGAVTVPVNLAISSLSQALLLTQTGMSFTTVALGGVVPPQSFGVVNPGAGTLAWTASTSTLSGGNWLSATPASGSSDPTLAAPQVTVSVNSTGLAAGDYYGLVQIAAPGAANTPQFVSVFMTVLPAGSDPGASVQPAELFFQATAGASAAEGPGSQQVLVYNVGAAPQTFYAAPSAALPFNFFIFPGGATLDPSQPTSVLMQPFDSFLPGTSSDLLTFQFSDGRVQTVKVHVISLPASSPASASATPAASGGKIRPQTTSAAPACAPTKLIPALTTLGEPFAVTAGWPVALSVDVMDDCGNPLTSGQVTVTFSDNSPPLGLKTLNNGTWQNTWSTQQTGAGQAISLTIAANDTQRQIAGTRLVQGALNSPKSPPVFTLAGVVSAAAPVSYTALAPGSIITIYGTFLADAAVPASTVPLPTTLGNASVLIQGTPVPLFYAGPGQIDALVPYGLNTNTSQSLVIVRDQTLSSVVPVNIADAQPGMFLGANGAIAVDYRGTNPTFLVSPSQPAQAGDVLVIYCGGLGLTTQPVVDGAASPSTQTQAPVTVSIGGQNANVLYAGLSAGSVGLYQVNVTMPPGVTPGTAVPIMITVAGQTSPVAVIATQ